MFKARLKALQQQFRNSRVEALPTTDEAVASLIERSIASTGLDPANEGLRNAVATTLLSLPQGSTGISVNTLRDVINQARMKQAAYNEIERIRTADKEAREKAKADVV